MTKVHFRSYIHKKMILFPQRIDKDIAEDDPVRLLDALVDNLMLDNVYKLYKPSGRKPYHPQMMLKVILYAYMNNIYSCRRIESLLKRDIHFIYLAGYEQPDFITINRFRNRVKKEINNIFTQVVLLLAAKGLISLWNQPLNLRLKKRSRLLEPRKNSLKSLRRNVINSRSMTNNLRLWERETPTARPILMPRLCT